MLGSIWANYDQVNHVIVSDPDPDGPHCADTAIWWGLGGRRLRIAHDLRQNSSQPHHGSVRLVLERQRR